MSLSRRARNSLAITAFIALVALIPVVDQFMFRYDWAAQARDELAFRHARLLGLREAAPQIEAALTRAQRYLQRHAYPADYPLDRVGAELQQRVRSLAEASGLTVGGSQILPPQPADGYEIVPINVTLSASPAALRELLVAFAAQSPSIQVDGYTITPARTRRGAADTGEVRVQLKLSAIHLKP